MSYIFIKTLFLSINTPLIGGEAFRKESRKVEKLVFKKIYYYLGGIPGSSQSFCLCALGSLLEGLGEKYGSLGS